MCLAVPLKVTEINNKEAIAEVESIKRKIRVDFVPKVKIGDYVMVHAGFAIEILDKETAEQNLTAMLEVADAAHN